MPDSSGIVVSKINSTTVALAANHTFTGPAENVTPYVEVDINVAGGPSNASGSLYFEFSPDGTHWDVSVLVSGSPLANPNATPPQYLRVVLPYFRIRYVNGSVAQTSFRLTTVYHRTGALRLTRYLNQNIDSTEGVENVRAVSMGQRPSGDYINLPAGGPVPSITTSTPLNANVEYVSNWTTTVGFVSISILVQADQVSAVDGIQIEYSDTSNGAVIRDAIKFSFTSNNVASTHHSHYYKVDNRADYIRIRFLNGNTAQTLFFFGARLNTVRTEEIDFPLDSTIKNTQSGDIINAVLRQQQAGGGDFITVSTDNPLPITGTVTANTTGLALDTSVNGILLSQSSTTSGELGPLIQGAVTTSSPTYTTGKTNPLSLTTSGLLRVDGSGATQPISGTVTSNAGTGNFTVVQSTASNLNATVNQGTNPWTTDVNDRAVRLLGVIYGSQGQQLKQTSSNFNTQVELAVGSSLIDPRSIRSLTSADVVTANAGSGTFTVGGTVTANIGTTGGLLLDSTFTNRINTLGQKTSANSTPVVLSSDQSAIPVSQSGTWTVQQGSAPWSISGSVTSNIGTTNGLALDATLTNGTTRSKITDGTNNVALSNSNPAGTEQALIVRNIPSGTQTVSGTLTTTQGSPASISNSWPVEITDGTNIVGTSLKPFFIAPSDSISDAFSRLRISDPLTIFDNKQLVDSAPLFWDDQQTSGSGTSSTYLTNQAATQISVSNTTAGTRVRQTFRRFNYQPGKASLLVLTGILGSGSSGITKRLGYFDSNNGLFFELNGTTMNAVVRTSTSGSAVDTATSQSSWNIDKLDGTGASGVTLDVTKTQIFVIDFQWLGTGRVRFGFYNAGKIIYVHQILNANVNTLVYMSIPNLPLRYEISNNGTGAAANLVHICTCVISEGGRDETGVVLSTDMGANTLTTLNNSNIYPLVAIRLKSSVPFATINPVSFTVVCTSTAVYKYSLILNPAIVGTSLSFSSITNSVVEFANPTNATTVTGGTVLVSGYDVSTTGSKSLLSVDINSVLTLGQNIAGVSDILVLAVQRITGVTESFLGSITWRESI